MPRLTCHVMVIFMQAFDIDPVIFHLGPLQVRWYGLMYVIGFWIGSSLLTHLSMKGFFKIPKEKVDNFVVLLILSMFLGARLTYVFVYNWDYYQHNFLELFSVWKGGLSFHGAILGFCTMMYFYAKKQKLHFLQVSDALAFAGTPGLFFGRIGNFINGELWGRVTDVPWAMIFNNPQAGPYPRHPSQLYEALLEGLILFLIIFFLQKKVKIHGILSATFMIGYGIFRFIVEFFREPDAQLGYYFGYFTMGQILCFMMIVIGGFILVYAKKKKIQV